MKLESRGIAGFTNALPLPHMDRGLAVVQKCPMQPQRASLWRKTRVAGPVACTETNEQVNVQHGLTITRQEILHRTRRGRAAKLRRWATLSEIDIPEGNDTRVDVWLVITRDRRDFRVRARVKSDVVRICDRCAKEYVAESDGRFDVVLRTGNAECEEEEAELVEASEEFGPGVGEVWLGDHVRDGVYLGVPTRSLCSNDCRGVQVQMAPEVGEVRYNFEDGASSRDDSTELGKKEVGQTLMELKRRLEEEGL